MNALTLKQERVLFKVAMDALKQISKTPRNRGAKRVSAATVAFIETQMEGRYMLADFVDRRRG